MNRLPLDVLHTGPGRISGNSRTRTGGWELQLDGRADTKFALHVDLSSVLLHDSVAYGKPKAGSFVRAVLRFGLGRKERIVDAVEMLLFDTCSRILNTDDHASGSIESGNLEHGIRSSEHSILGVQHQIENYLLKLALIAVNTGKM